MTNTDLEYREIQKASKCVNKIACWIELLYIEISSFVWTVCGVFQRSTALKEYKEAIDIDYLQLSSYSEV